MKVRNRFNRFSAIVLNEGTDINPSYASSVEALHDKIHNYVGGDNSGHMSDPAVAGTITRLRAEGNSTERASIGHDPIFFMHHANVDRLTALWQAIHYTSFVPTSVAEDGTWVYAAGSKIGETTCMSPSVRCHPVSEPTL